MANTKSSDQKQAPSIIEVAAASIDFAWDYTPVERALCCRLFAEQAIQGLRAAGYVIVPLETASIVRDMAEWHDRASRADGDDFLNGDASDGRNGHAELEALGARAMVGAVR